MSLAYAPPLTTKQKPPTKPDAPPGYQPGFEVPSIQEIVHEPYHYQPQQTLRERMSRADFLALPDTELKLEWADGWAILMAPELTTNIDALMELVMLLKQAFPSFGVYHEAGLAMGASGNLRRPDLTIYPHKVGSQYWVTDKPIIVAEALSKTTRKQDIGAKRAEYAARGIDQYWLIDTAARRIEVLVNIAGEYVTSVVITDESPFAQVGISKYGTVELDLKAIMPN